MRLNRILHENGFSFLSCAVEKEKVAPRPPRPDILFEDWNKETYAGWTVEGTAFGSGPVKRSAVPDYQGDLGGEGERVVNSHASAPAQDVAGRDAQTGKLTSRRFTVERDFLQLWVGGGTHEGRTCVNLVVDGKTALSVTGRNNNHMTSADVRRPRSRRQRGVHRDRRRGDRGLGQHRRRHDHLY